ncbi:hypothetical protein [Chromatium okenii]|jgi:hypothetical protein|uniref:hypothetical protein n=1 Tax=Chromatium okenii TaxID=61644 RepID=UPI0026F235BD|nr:hypothetical protein [Chromatium okenii]MBV5310742.1 hypothetical protein [Chromatium okenii]
MIESIVLLISVIVGGGVLVYTMNDFLLGFVKNIVLPAIKHAQKLNAEQMRTCGTRIEEYRVWRSKD